MSKITHIVIAYDHTTKSFTYDEDGTEVWIRQLFLPESNTWSDEAEDYIGGDENLVKETIEQWEKLLERVNK
jgi:hypothetical protein